jgi:succinate dehydrogenase hydrophobic anchor subunit
LNQLIFLLALPQAIPTGILIIGCMAQITNTLNSADSTPKTQSTTPSDDEDDITEHHQFLTPSSNLNSPITNKSVVTFHTIVKINNDDNDSEHVDDISYGIQPSMTTTTTTLTTPQLQTYLNLSAASSETSLARPLLNEEHQTLAVYTPPNNNEDERTASSASSTTSTTSSSSSMIPNCRSYMTLYFTDMLISAFIITPFVNIHWRGAWDLLDIHLLPDSPAISALISFGIGYFMLYTMYLGQGYLQRFYERNRHNVMGQIMTRVYTLILALAYIHQWRGLWNLLDLTSNNSYHLLGQATVTIIFLLLMKSIYNLISAPFLIGIDTESYFLLDSKYTVTTNHFWQYTFDFFYYEIVEAPLLIIAWHSVYNISDLYIYPDPDDKRISLITSFASGYLAYFLLAFIQIPVVKFLMKRGNRTLHSIVTNLFHLIAFASVVQIWRSLWLICEQYLNITNYHNTTLWLCYGVSFFVLTCGLAAGSLNGPGGSKDSYVDEEPILLFKFDYFSSLLRVSLIDLFFNLIRDLFARKKNRLQIFISFPATTYR